MNQTCNCTRNNRCAISLIQILQGVRISSPLTEPHARPTQMHPSPRSQMKTKPSQQQVVLLLVALISLLSWRYQQHPAASWCVACATDTAPGTVTTGRQRDTVVVVVVGCNYCYFYYHRCNNDNYTLLARRGCVRMSRRR